MMSYDYRNGIKERRACQGHSPFDAIAREPYHVERNHAGSASIVLALRDRVSRTMEDRDRQ